MSEAGLSDIMRLGMAFWGSKTLLSAVELGVFTELAASGPLTHQMLRGKLGLAERGSRDFLDALVALGMLNRVDGHYQNTAATARYLAASSPEYVGGMLEMANDRLYPFWGNLTRALRTGEPQNEVAGGGQGMFETLYADPARLRQFLRAMTGLGVGTAHALTAKFPLPDARTCVDVGCAEGALPVAIARAFPAMTCVGFDLPEVRPAFEEYVAARGLSDRVTFHPGDFRSDPLPPADVMVMGHILHDWDLETKLMLLSRAHEALDDGGVLIVYESLIDDAREASVFGLLMSLNMLVETPGGFDFTGEDCQAWMRSTGFRETWTEPLAGPESMVVAIKLPGREVDQQPLWLAENQSAHHRRLRERRPVGQRRDRQLGLQPRQRRPDAEVRAVGEREVPSRVRPVRVVPVRILEHRRVAVRPGDRYRHLVARPHPGTGYDDVPGCVSVNHGGSRLQPQRLFDGEGPVGKRVQDRVGDHPLGCLNPAEQQDRRV